MNFNNMKIKNLIKSVLVASYSYSILFIISLFIPVTNILNTLREGIGYVLIIGLALYFSKTYKNYENDETSIW